jgi:hypothetical protein
MMLKTIPKMPCVARNEMARFILSNFVLLTF